MKAPPVHWAGKGNEMADPRYLYYAFAGLFIAVSIFATATTVRHISHRDAQVSIPHP
jgi:uncharacterized membrane protein